MNYSLPPVTLASDIPFAITAPAPLAPSVGYEVEYYLPGSGVRHSITVSSPQDCQLLRHHILQLRSIEPTLSVTTCRTTTLNE